MQTYTHLDTHDIIVNKNHFKSDGKIIQKPLDGVLSENNSYLGEEVALLLPLSGDLC